MDINSLRHSLAHLLAMAVKTKYPKAKLGIGPAIDNGFYYDFDLGGETLAETDLDYLEKTMRSLISKNLEFKPEIVSAEEAREIFANEPYKLELLDELIAAHEPISIYRSGDPSLKDRAGFVDLCAGPHVASSEKIPRDAFCLDRLAGAYWRGDEKNKMLTRIYGLAFDTKPELTDYQEKREEAERRDHRKLGAELELFTFSPSIGPGLVVWLPKGNIIKESLEEWAKETEEKSGYVRVTTPIITKEDLFYISEHLPHYKDSMYSPMDIEGEKYYIKPMNCPFHHTIFSHKKRSYRELPLRLAEYGWCHRYEDSGSLFGLMRVRGMQMNDAHIYCTKEQAVQEFVDVIKLHQYYYDRLGIKDYYMELALRNPENKKYHGDDAMWQEAEALMREAMEISKVPYVVQNDGAAFYGPKIDFQIKSTIGRVFTASTNQIDLFMPKKFDLKYLDKDGQEKYVVCIHRAPLGTHERFIGFLIEHFAGNFPTWLSPVQVKILPISEKQMAYAQEVFAELKAKGIRVELDETNETLGKKIRSAKMQKIPYLIVIGEKEMDEKTITVETRGGDKGEKQTLAEFAEKIGKEVKERN